MTTSLDGFSHLALDEVTESDTGEYEAVASNAVGSVVARFLLVVDEGPADHFAPRFASPLANQLLKPGTKNLLLHTKISASPYVAINWYRNGAKIRNSGNVHKYFDREGNATLALVNQEDGVTGQYTCTAFNEGGENSISVHVEPSTGERYLLGFLCFLGVTW